MTNTIYILLLSFILLLFSREANAQSKFWIFLKDKGKDGKAIETLRAQLPERCLERRLKSGARVTEEDFDVCEEYVEQIGAAGVEVVITSRWFNAVSVNASSEELNRIRSLPFVKAVQPVAVCERNAPDMIDLEQDLDDSDLAVPLSAYGESFTQAYQANVIEAHKRGYSGDGVLLGMLDTGFQLDHRAFAGLKVVAQYDFIFNDPDPSYDPVTDRRGQAHHGSACLSVIAGYEPGVLIGIAPGVSVVLGKTELTGDEIRAEEDFWIAGLEWFEWLGVDVVSSSLSYRKWYSIEDYNGVTPLITRAAQRAFELGMVICNSAGNAGPQKVTIGAPSDAPGVLAVAAVENTGIITGFSSRGPSSDGRIKPDIAAMGRGVRCISPLTWDEYSRWNGTSLACPIVAGVAALVIEAHPEWSSRQVVEAMTETAGRAMRPDNAYGYGIVNAAAAIDYPSINGRIMLIGKEVKTRFRTAEFMVELWKSNRLIDRKFIENGWYDFRNLEKGVYTLKLRDQDRLIDTYDNLTVPPSAPVDLVIK